jgi:hypothetical protein
VNEKLLRESKLVRGQFAGIKILGDGELKHALTIEADKVSAGARERIEKAGGTITLRQKQVAPEKPAENTVQSGAADPETTAKPSGRKRPTTKQRAKAKPSRKK